MRNYWISVDPSINNIGYCIWADTDLIGYGSVKSKNLTKLNFQQNKNTVGLLAKANSINEQLKNDLKDFKLFRAVMEFPGSYTRDNKNVASLEKLLFSIGILTNFFILEKKCSVEFITVAEWKGNTPKQYTDRYVRQYMNLTDKETLSDHISDACGIGLYYIKKLRLAA